VSALSWLTNLKYLDLSGCTGLTDVSALSGLTNLEYLDLSGCAAIRNLSGLSELGNLVWLKLSRCTGLTNLSGLSGLTNLKWFCIFGCTGLSYIDSFPDSLLELRLCHLNLRPYGFTTDLLKYVRERERRRRHSPTFLYMPPFPRNLENLDLSGSKGFKSYQEIGELENLKKLSIADCRNFVVMPDLRHCDRLEYFDLRGTSFVTGLGERLVEDAATFGDRDSVVALLNAIQRKGEKTSGKRGRNGNRSRDGQRPAKRARRS
jgi:internalin A